MAKGRRFARVQVFLAVFGVVAGFVIYGLVTGWNPLPGVANWLEDATVRHLSSPRPLWTDRSGNAPDWATVLPQAIVVGTEGEVEVRNPTTGSMMWKRADAWAAVAGGSDPVVLVGHDMGNGFDAFQVETGIRLWSVTKRAGIWAYSDMVLVLTCGSGCTLQALDPISGKARWSVGVPGSGATLMGYDHTLAQPVPVSSSYATPLRADPGAAPEFVGLPMSGQVDVVATNGSRKVHVFTPDKFTRTVVAGSVVVSSTATVQNGACYFAMTVSNPTTGAELHRQVGLDLRTASECDTRHDPGGSGQYLVGRDTSGRDVIFDAQAGTVVYRAAADARIVAMDDQIAIVRSATGTTLTAVRPSSGMTLWHAAGSKADLVGVAPGFVIAADPENDGSINVYDRSSGHTLTTVTSTATVLGVGPSTVVINIGRTIGPLVVPAST